MKRLIVVGALGLLLSACDSAENNTSKIEARKHVIYCQDSITKQPTFEVSTRDNVYAFVIKGHSVLGYKDNDDKMRVIFLSKNDCVVF